MKINGAFIGGLIGVLMALPVAAVDFSASYYKQMADRAKASGYTYLGDFFGNEVGTKLIKMPEGTYRIFVVDGPGSTAVQIIPIKEKKQGY